MSESEFLNGDNNTSKSPTPRVFLNNSEKKLKLEDGEQKEEVTVKAIDESLDPNSQSNSNLKVKLNGKDVDLMDSSLNSSSLWTSTENSFVQVTDKLLHRGIQTDYLNNANAQNVEIRRSKTPTTALMMSHSNSISAPSANFEMIQNKRESM